MIEHDYDVVVTGGGPAGSACAQVLAKAGHRVVLLESGDGTSFRVGEGLPPAAKPLLRDLGCWDAFLADGHAPSYGNQSAWGMNYVQSTDFIHNPNGHGWHLDRARFDGMLRQKAEEVGVTLWENTTLDALAQNEDDTWSLQLSGTHSGKITCSILVDATGRRAVIARKMGVKRILEDRLIAFYALFEADESGDEDSMTLIEAVANGWWYTALLPSGKRIVVFFTEGNTRIAKQAQSTAGFLELLGASIHLTRRLAAFNYLPVTAPQGTGADSSRLEKFYGENWLAVGDAATAFDPLSSQGMLTALYGGLKAGEAINARLAGKTGQLEQYGAQLTSVFEYYLQQRKQYYAREQRWEKEPFWQSRHPEGSFS